MSNNTIYLPGLNGLRAIASMGVLISHITLGLAAFKLDPFIFGSFQDGTPIGLQLGGFGVSIFFALSGFLITFLLLQEISLSGTIKIKKFYFRRILRIWPLYYLYLIIAIIVIISSGMDLDIKSLSLYLFFAANIPFILNSSLIYLGHFWSIGVEEQFYIWWPWVVKKKPNQLIEFVISLVAILIITKLVLHFYFPNSILELAIHITRFQCMLIGAFGAILFKKKNAVFLRLIDNKLTQLVSIILILLLTINKFHIASVIDNEIISTVTVFIIIGQINITNRIINLNKDIFDFLGKISYGIYVIHPLIILLASKVLGLFEVEPVFKYIIVYSSITGLTILTSYLTYTYFEKYFLHFKTKVSVIQSASTKHDKTI